MTNARKPVPTVANVLPPDARDALVKAAATKNDIADKLRRQKAIEKATQRAKFQYPHHFKHTEI